MHDCLIHELSVYIPSNGIWRTAKKSTGLNNTPGSPVSVHPTDPAKHTVGRTGGQASNHRKSVEDKVELVWEAKTSNTTYPAPRLQSLSDEKLVSGTTALMDIV